MSTDPKVMQIATQNSHSKGAGIEKYNNALRYFTGCKFPFFNGVFNDDQNNALECIENLEKATQFFTDQDTPFMVVDPTKGYSTQHADTKGFQSLGKFLGVAAQCHTIPIAAPGEQIEIGMVQNDTEYQYFLDILCEVFQMSEVIKSDLKAMYSTYGPQGKFRHYVGYYAGEPAATLTSFSYGPVVGLYNGATLTRHHKHGLCTALANHAIQAAISQGCQYAVSQLMTPEMTQGISDKMGFQTHCTLLPFLKDPRAPA